MSSYRLKKDQVKWLKKMGGCNTLEYIIMRYKRGDFNNVTQNDNKKENASNVLQKKESPLEVFSIRKRFDDIDDNMMRNLIDLHRHIEDIKMKSEIKKAKQYVDELFRAYTNQEYILLEE